MHAAESFAEHPLWSKVKMGTGVKIGHVTRLYGDPSKLTLGDDVNIDDMAYLLVLAPLYIGAGAMIGPHVTLQAHEKITINDGAHIMCGARLLTRYPVSGRSGRDERGAIVIGSFALVGANAVIMPGVSLDAAAEVQPNGVET